MINMIKRNIKNCDKVLLFLTCAMFIFGLLNIVTASSREAVVRYDESLYYYFFKQLEMLLIGLSLSLFIICVNTKVYHKWGKLAFIIILSMCLYLLIYGKSVKGALNWLTIPIINIAVQPSEFAKVVIIVFLGSLLEKNYDLLRNKNKKKMDKIGIILLVGLFIPAIVFLQKDFGTMFIMCVIFFVMFASSSILFKDKVKIVAFLSCLLLLFCGLLYLKQGYIFTDAQLARFEYLKPCSKYETTGYQICNGYIAINNGGLFGLGISKSKQIYSYIPEPHTDSVFAIIAEENGVLKCAIIFIIYIIILWRIIKISIEATSIRGKYISLGVATYLFMHIFVNLGGLFGLIPLTGVPLPFLSYGGSFTISLMCALSIVQRINIETKKAKKTY